MPRRAYIADLQKLQESVSTSGIAQVKPGGDDGEFMVQIAPPTGVSPFWISALIPDLSDYPTDHTYHIFVADDDAPAFVGQTLERLPNTSGKTLPQLMDIISKKFNSSVDQDGDYVMPDSQLEESEDGESDEGYDSDSVFDIDGNAQVDSQINTVIASKRSSMSITAKGRVRSDLNLTKAAGFKVGCHGALLEGGGCYLSVSIRVSKLGISEEALEAWQLKGNEYLILLIHYPNGYKTLDDVGNYDSHQARQNIDFRVGCSNTYKPTISETIKAFTQLSKEKGDNLTPSQHAETQAYRDVFISQPLNQLLKERLPTIIRYRYQGLGWTAAENFFNDHQGKGMNGATASSIDDAYSTDETINRPFPSIVTMDHITETTAPHSLPLAAMQFLLRHFVRCTEFCLVCHCKLDNDLEAIKPYVCEKPLCLYQYMSLGFGPSIEHEIIWQPHVVDLLISFCFTTARSKTLKTFPTGLSLSVPPVAATSIPGPGRYSQFDRYAAKYNPETGELLFHKDAVCPLKAGDWIQLAFVTHDDKTVHVRVKEATYFPTVTLASPVVAKDVVITAPPAPQYVANNKTSHQSSESATEQLLGQSGFKDVRFTIYDRNFDTLTDHEKQDAMAHIMTTLPPVSEMKEYLASRKDAKLSSWVDRLSPAAVGMLRWIIASNRACIMQSKGAVGSKLDDRVSGMKGWMQFRFAMGAPDKESRFQAAVNSTKNRLGLKHPTLFAFHGSPLHNWHSIIREGLHYNTVTNGRAYGDGVYHSLQFQTSAGYAVYYRGGGSAGACHWPNSELQITNAMAINEIVNAPKEFVSQSPHLVVKQLDWIQTRYLFVKCTSDVQDDDAGKNTNWMAQDPGMTAHGESGKIQIPAAVSSRSHRRDGRNMVSISRASESFSGRGSISDPIDLDDDTASVDTDIEDINILLDDDEISIEAIKPTAKNSLAANNRKPGLFGGLKRAFGSKNSKTSVPQTDFVPGALDYSTLSLLAEPRWASPIATRRLQKDFQAIVKIQNSTPLHELGWYTNPEMFNNVYQWIVEFHSFEEKLPLAKQMKTQKIKSVVMELRFGADYPMSPPFIRVIRPRFLSFAAGGGGHVTAGGSLCMELLTNSGWSAVSSIESVLLQVRLALSSTDPRPAQLEASGAGAGRTEYGVGEAIEAYVRACNMHGWTVPAGFREMAWGGEEPGGRR